MEKMTRSYDIVFCVDVSGSAATYLELVKKWIWDFPSFLVSENELLDRRVSDARIKIVPFRDLSADANGLSVSPWFVVEPDGDSQLLRRFLDELEAIGGGDEPESALEALGVAINSPWARIPGRRSVIVLFTDASAHKLENRVGQIPEEFRHQVPASLDELKQWWGESSYLLSAAGRVPGHRTLLVFGPDAYPWHVIGDSFAHTCWFPSREPGHFEVNPSSLWSRIEGAR